MIDSSIAANHVPVLGLAGAGICMSRDRGVALRLVFTTITDPNGHVTRQGYNQYGRLVKSVDGRSLPYPVLMGVFATACLERRGPLVIQGLTARGWYPSRSARGRLTPPNR